MLKKLVTIIVVTFMFVSCNKKQATPKVINSSPVIEKYAYKLNVNSSELDNPKLYSFIDEWYGVKYKFGGMTKSGVDCSGFANLLYLEVYQKEMPRMTRDIAKAIEKVPQEKLSEGDLVFFNISGKSNSHVGVYLANNYFVHASTSKGVIISNLTNPYYKKSYSKGGKL